MYRSYPADQIPYARTSGTPIASRSSDDAEQRYFIYRYVYEMGKILNADPTRIQALAFQSVAHDIQAAMLRNGGRRCKLIPARSCTKVGPFFKFIDRSAMPEQLPNQVDPKLQIEYAESWLQGRFMGAGLRSEEWQKQRRVIASIAPGSQGSGIESKSAAAPRQHTYPVKGRVAQVLFQRNPSARRCMAELMVSCSDRAVDGAAKEANRHRFDTRL
ncbi:hypothetical protein AK812_SmicGene16738 [Symbiodinium microadriaticum]|uniref:Uncharacterized protein n=1 Tax=Symbiodinium microadriaticum TaxID=2951 RepID=A0A1Q9DZJ0_SYMMI|nr:hypothetical protein AK812_SmicGene16738 [Symbiodinium microadriaticum]